MTITLHNNSNRPRSLASFDEAKQIIPGGVNSPVRAFGAVGGTPVFFSRAEGAYLWCEDGHRYIDYIGSWGPMVLGHCYPKVVEAVQQQAARAMSFGAPTSLEAQLAHEIKAVVPSIDMIRMVSSGTEATMSAIRLARGYTKRNVIIKFEGCYHGHGDMLLVKAGSGALTFGNPTSSGVPPEAVKHTMVLQFNDIPGLQAAFVAHGKDIACVIVEPVAGNMNLIPPMPGFLDALRDCCDQAGSVLIFDEVMTGFRVALGGAQALFGVKPDLTTLGKVIGGGMPMGAFGGKAEIMQCLAPLGAVYQAGTLSGNPLAVTAGLATIREVKRSGFFAALEDRCTAMVEGVVAEGRKRDFPVSGLAIGGMFGIYFSDLPPRNYAEVQEMDKPMFNRFFHAMLDRGVYLAPAVYEAGFVSAAHSEVDIAYTVAAAADAFESLKR